MGLLKWLHQAGNGDYAAAIDGLMKQAAMTPADTRDALDRSASTPKA
jgi:hypothetical protein